MKKIRVLIVGLGRIASILEEDPYRNKPCTHAGALLSPPMKKKFQIEAIFDKKNERINEFLLRHKLSGSKIQTSNPFSPTVSFLGEIDLAVIATQTSDHINSAKYLIQKGVKNILVEKPLARSRKDAVSLKKIAEKNNARIWVNHERRYHSVYKYFRDELQAGKWGRILKINAEVLTSRLDPGHAFSHEAVGPLFHDGTHAVDFIQWLLGDPIRIRSRLTKSNSRYKVEERALAWLEYKNDVNVFLEAGGYRKYFRFELEIQTESARIILGNDGFRVWETKPSSLYKGFRSLMEVVSPLPKSILKNPNPFINLYNSIHHSIENNLAPATGDLYDNLKILQILDRIQSK